MSELPKVRLRGRIFYVDTRIQELRNVSNPHDHFSMRQLNNSEVQKVNKVLEAASIIERARNATSLSNTDFTKLMSDITTFPTPIAQSTTTTIEQEFYSGHTAIGQAEADKKTLDKLNKEKADIEKEKKELKKQLLSRLTELSKYLREEMHEEFESDKKLKDIAIDFHGELRNGLLSIGNSERATGNMLKDILVRIESDIGDLQRELGITTGRANQQWRSLGESAERPIRNKRP